VAFVATFFMHQGYLNANEVQLSIPITQIYTFFFIAGLFTVAGLETIAQFVPDKVAYGFMALMMLKLGVFTVFYGGDLFGEIELPKVQRLAFVIPMFVMLIIEAVDAYWLLGKE
jgi:hypothetical protein